MELKNNHIEPEAYQKYERAKKRVKKIRGFHRHLIVFLIVTVIIFATRFIIMPRLGFVSDDQGFVNWLNWNTYLMPLLWGFVIIIQAVFVFGKKIKALQRWEERKIKELLEKESQTGSDNYK